jgi:hypothetical protein
MRKPVEDTERAARLLRVLDALTYFVTRIESACVSAAGVDWLSRA